MTMLPALRVSRRLPVGILVACTSPWQFTVSLAMDLAAQQRAS